jgi:hypothetical protein
MQALLIFRFTPKATLDAVVGMVKAESRRNWELYAAGIFRQSWLFEDLSGAVVIAEVESQAQANDVANGFPMVEAGYLTTEAVILRPYMGIEELFAEPFTPQRLSAPPPS